MHKILYCQRVLRCSIERLATTIDNIHWLFANKGSYDLFHTCIEESLNLNPDQPRVSVDEFGQLLMLVQDRHKDAGLGEK